MRFSTLLTLCFLLPTALFSQISIEQREHLDSIFKSYDDVEVPGCAVAIVRNGEIIFQKGYGMADLERGIPITPESVFYAGSISKQFVAAAALILSDRGELDLMADVHDYLPDLPQYSQPISVQNLIYHTSGIRDYFSLLEEAGLNYLNEVPRKVVYDLIRSEKDLEFNPGQKYQYSNSGYLLLAMIIEQIANTSLATFVEKEIFDVLGMQHSVFLDDNRKIVLNRAWGYHKNIDGEIENMIMRFDLVGSGGLYTTVGDLYLWDQNLYESKFGSPGFLNRLLTTGRLNDGRDTNYAFAIRKDSFRGLPVIGQSGSLGGYRAQFMQFPSERFSIIILSNLDKCKPGELAHQVANVFLKGAFLK